MRIVLLIVMVLAWLVAAGMGLMIGLENLTAEDLDSTKKMLEQMGQTDLLAKLDGFGTSGIGGLLVALTTTIGVVLTFIKKSQPQLIAVGLGVVVAILFIALSPGFDTTALGGGADPRGQAMVYGVASIIALLAGLGAEKLRQKKAANG